MNNDNVNPSTSMPPDSLSMNVGLAGGGGAGMAGGVSVTTGGSTRRTSRVWRYFGMVDNCHYICRLCSFVGAYTNTTNMRKHIQHHHPERFQDILDHTRPTTRPYYAGALPRMRQPHHYPQHNLPHHYSPGLLYPPAMSSKRMMLTKPTDVSYFRGDARNDSALTPAVTSHECSVAAATATAQATAVTCQPSLQEPVSYPPQMTHTAAPATPTTAPSVTMCELSPEETKLVKQLIPALGEATDCSTDSETPSRGLQAPEDRSGSDFSHNNSDDVPLPVSPQQFLSEANEQDDPVPVPPTPTQQKPESYQLRHNNHLTIVLEALARDESFMDVTLTAQGRSLKAHKSVLSAVSSYFRGVLRDNPCQHPIIIMPRDVRFEELYSIVNYIYKGEMTVAAEDLTSLLKTAEILQVSGLAPSDSSATVNPQTESATAGNVRSSSTSSSASSSNIPPVSRTSRAAKVSSQSITTPPARPRSIDSMINPADFIDVDMTCVKEEVLSGDEDDDDEKDEQSNKVPCSQPTSSQPTGSQSADCSQPVGCSQPIGCPQPADCSMPAGNGSKDDIDPDQTLLTYSSQYEQSLQQPIPSTSSQEDDFRGLGIKSDPETEMALQAGNSKENPQPLFCPHCEEQYRDVDSIAAHLRIKHPTKPSFTCKCGRIFTRQIHHQAHTRMCSNSS